MKKVYYESFSDELVKNSNQDYKLKDNFKWIHTNIFYIFISYIVYLFFVLVGFIYLKVYYRIKFVNKKIIKKYKKYYIYSNHVLEIGDPFIPLVSNFPRRSFTLVNPANLGVPVIGKLIPMVGGIPIPDNVHIHVTEGEVTFYHRIIESLIFIVLMQITIDNIDRPSCSIRYCQGLLFCRGTRSFLISLNFFSSRHGRVHNWQCSNHCRTVLFLLVPKIENTHNNYCLN